MAAVTFKDNYIIIMMSLVMWLGGLNLYSLQGSHRLEKYLNLEGFLEKSLKIKSALKSTGKSLKSLEKSLDSTIFSVGLVDRELNQYKIVVPLFGAAKSVFVINIKSLKTVG